MDGECATDAIDWLARWFCHWKRMKIMPICRYKVQYGLGVFPATFFAVFLIAFSSALSVATVASRDFIGASAYLKRAILSQVV
jgi:hypothetical protein